MEHIHIPWNTCIYRYENNLIIVELIQCNDTIHDQDITILMEHIMLSDVDYGHIYEHSFTLNQSSDWSTNFNCFHMSAHMHVFVYIFNPLQTMNFFYEISHPSICSYDTHHYH